MPFSLSFWNNPRAEGREELESCRARGLCPPDPLFLSSPDLPQTVSFIHALIHSFIHSSDKPQLAAPSCAGPLSEHQQLLKTTGAQGVQAGRREERGGSGDQSGGLHPAG